MTENVALPTFPFPGSTYRGPSPLFSRLRESNPVVRVDYAGGGHAWVVTRYADVQAVLDDPRFSRAATYLPEAPKFAGLFQAPPGMIISLDPPEHTRLRVLAEQAFSPARIEGMRPRIRELANGFLDELEKNGDGPADMVEGFAARVAMATICELLGVPETDRDLFLGWIRKFADVSGPEEEAIAAREQLGGYMAGLVGAKMQNPGEDVLSDLIAARNGEDRLSFEELVGLGFTLLGGGFDSSAAQIGNFVLTLLTQHQRTWVWLGEHPEHVASTVEELLRTVNLTDSDTSGLPRLTTEDVTIAGVTIPKGEAVFLSFTSANHDEAAFPDPEKVDFARSPNPHVAFGYGIHRCIGAPLATVELQVAVEELTRRYPHARLAVPEEELTWRVGDVNHNLIALPVLLRG